MVKKIEKQRRKTCSKPFSATFLVFAIVFLTSIPIIFALNWDNAKDFDGKQGKYGKIKIKDTFGLGDTISEYELTKNTFSCTDNCFAELEVVMNEKNVLVEEVSFKKRKLDMTWKDTNNVPYQVYIKSGSKWIAYELGSEVEPGTYEIRIEGDKPNGWTVDWIIETQGVSITEWATWEDVTKLEFYETGAGGYKMASGIQERMCQTFTMGAVGPSGNYESLGVSFNYTCDGCAMEISLKSLNSSGLPADLLSYNSTYTGISLAAYGIVNATLSPSVQLNEGTTYAICMNGTNAQWAVDNTTATYPGGNYIEINGSGHYNVSNDDALFVVWGSAAPAIVTVNNPTNNSIVLNYNTRFNCSATDGTNLLNLSLYIDGVLENSTFNTTAGTTELSLEYLKNLSIGDHTANCTSWDLLDRQVNSTINYFNASFFNVNSETYNASAYETDRESFKINITTNNTATFSANLIYNGNSYPGTKVGDNSVAEFTVNLDIPTAAVGTPNFYWDVTSGAQTNTSSLHTQTVSGIKFYVCNSSGIRFLNTTYYDETNSSSLNVTIPASTFSYYLGSGTVMKSLTYSNSTLGTQEEFCFFPEDKSVHTNYTFSYADTTHAYPQRTLGLTETFSNITLNKSLYLLKSTAGLYVTFQVINTAEQSVSGVFVNVTRSVGGVETLIGSGYTNDAGVITFLLNPDIEHTFIFSATGYNIYMTTMFPTQSSYTINLGSGTTAANNDYTRGISYNIAPTNISLLNDTAYDFQFNLTSDYWTVTEFGFILINSSGQSVGSNSISANGGTSSLNYNVGNTTDSIRMNYYWVIDSNYTNRTVNWYVLSSAGTDWSIRNFFTDFNIYFDVGLFGMNDFAKRIIIFIIIFTFVGIMSYKFGLVSPVGVSVLAFGLVLFFDTMGMIPSPLQNTVDYFPTILMGLIMIGVFFREVYK